VVTALTCIQEVPASNLVQVTDFSGKAAEVFFCSSTQMLE
jgi:hypothetical protein